jgi:hypothetical protein
MIGEEVTNAIFRIDTYPACRHNTESKKHATEYNYSDGTDNCEGNKNKQYVRKK